MMAATATAPRAVSPVVQRERAKLSMLREVFVHGTPYQDWVGDWWRSLSVEDRRLLLALCGYDDTEEAAARPWAQMLQEQRDKLLTECKRLGALLARVRLA